MQNKKNKNKKNHKNPHQNDQFQVICPSNKSLFSVLFTRLLPLTTLFIIYYYLIPSSSFLAFFFILFLFLFLICLSDCQLNQVKSSFSQSICQEDLGWIFCFGLFF
jgi:hypothetical protein